MLVAFALFGQDRPHRGSGKKIRDDTGGREDGRDENIAPLSARQTTTPDDRGNCYRAVTAGGPPAVRGISFNGCYPSFFGGLLRRLRRLPFEGDGRHPRGCRRPRLPQTI